MILDSQRGALIAKLFMLLCGASAKRLLGKLQDTDDIDASIGAEITAELDHRFGGRSWDVGGIISKFWNSGWMVCVHALSGWRAMTGIKRVALIQAVLSKSRMRWKRPCAPASTRDLFPRRPERQPNHLHVTMNYEANLQNRRVWLMYFAAPIAPGRCVMG